MANFNFNKIILGGRLTAEPELRQTNSGIAVCSFSIAVNRRKSSADVGEPATDFFNCAAWRGTAELVAKYFHKGSSICVSGTIQNDNYTDKDGIKRYATTVQVNEAYFVDSKAEQGNYTAVPQNAPQTPQMTPVGAPETSYMPQQYSGAADNGGFEPLDEDDGLPF